jgi:hypothetical protein
MMDWVSDGCVVFPRTSQTAAWANAAHAAALAITADPAQQGLHLRHGKTWFVGVDALPNLSDGSIGGVALAGLWEDLISPSEPWHRAQLSVVYPGYPRRDPDETDVAHRFRHQRFAAHVDGLLPVGDARRRFLGEWHGFILGLPLNISDAAPLMIWPGSHQLMGDALRHAIDEADPTQVDLTDAYQAARRQVFDTITPVAVVAEPGQAILLHRHLLHGVAPFLPDQSAPSEGRMIAYFRPSAAGGPAAWLAKD